MLDCPYHNSTTFAHITNCELLTTQVALCSNSLVIQINCCSSCPVGFLRQSWKLGCWGKLDPRMWDPVVTRGLQLCGQIDIMPNSLKHLWRQLVVEKWTANSPATALADILSQHANYRLPPKLQHLRLCCVIELHILKWPCMGGSLRHTCAIITLSNQHLGPVSWMDALGKWEVLAKPDLGS